MPTRYLEPGLNMLSGLLAEPVAGWAGLLSGNPDNVEKTRNALTYQPRTAEGKAGMNKLAGLLSDAKTVMVDQNPPVRMALEGYNALADRAGAVSPVLGAAVKTAPTALGLLAGPGTAPVRSAFKNVAKDSYANAGKVPAVRGPLAAQDGMIGFKPEPTDPLRYQSDDVRASVREKMTPEAIQALSKYGSPDDAPLNEVMATLDGAPVSAYEFPQDAALETARRNAVTMLGLPEDNTPMDRAKALGFYDGWKHGSPNPNIEAFDPTLAGQRGMDFGAATFATKNGDNASGYSLNWKDYEAQKNVNPKVQEADARRMQILSQIVDSNRAGDKDAVERLRAELQENGNAERNLYDDFLNYKLPSEGSTVYPLMIRADDMPWVDGGRQNFSKVNAAAIEGARQSGAPGVRINDVADNSGRFNGTSDVMAVFEPNRLRSRFAAFDPARINENNLLGAADPRFLGLTAGGGLLGLLGMGYSGE